MIVDCHVHIAPDHIAAAVEAATARNFNLGMPLAGRMNAAGILDGMAASRVDASVVFNVAHRPDLVKLANDFIIEINDNKRLIGLGTIHPALDHPEDEVARLRAHGVRGIKFHALVQRFGAADERLGAVYEAMGEDMVAFFHSGLNPGHPSEPALNTPQVLAGVKKAFPRLKIVAAHFGGLGMLEETRQWIAGKDIHIDSSWSPGTEVLDAAGITELIRRHGSERVLFGTDYPVTSGVRRQIEWIERLPLGDEDRENIFWRNAVRLFAAG